MLLPSHSSPYSIASRKYSRKKHKSHKKSRKKTQDKKNNEKNTRQIRRESLREEDYERIPAVPRTDNDAVDVYWVLLCMALGLRHLGEGPGHIERGRKSSVKGDKKKKYVQDMYRHG